MSPVSIRSQFADCILVIPAYEEAATIRRVVEGALRFVERIIVVDDGSRDGTADALAGLPVTVLCNAQNKGKAASLWRGLSSAVDHGANAVLTMDGDGQHGAEDIPRLLEAARRFPDRFVIGSRLWDKAAIPKARYRANRFANFWIAWASGQPVEDSQSGFRVYPAELIRRARIKVDRERGFVFESEIVIEAARLGFHVLPVPVRAIYSDNARPSHFRPVMDIARITRMVAWKLLSRGLYPQGLWHSLVYPPISMETKDARIPGKALK
jgi:glycosyltransferase involved in cell wall biosynthesis